MSRRSLHIVLSAIVVVSIIAMVSTVYIYEGIYVDPRYSWNPAIRDHDGDGVPDRSDPRPFDPTIRAYGRASVDLTVLNNYTVYNADYINIFFAWTLDSKNWGNSWNASGIREISPNDIGNKSFNVSWLMGEAQADLWIFVHGEAIPSPVFLVEWHWLQNFTVEDGQLLKLSIAFPSDANGRSPYGQ